MRMANRRVWSIFLAFMMLISMLPMSVSAEGNFTVDSGGAAAGRFRGSLLGRRDHPV